MKLKYATLSLALFNVVYAPFLAIILWTAGVAWFWEMSVVGILFATAIMATIPQAWATKSQKITFLLICALCFSTFSFNYVLSWVWVSLVPVVTVIYIFLSYIKPEQFPIVFWVASGFVFAFWILAGFGTTAGYLVVAAHSFFVESIEVESNVKVGSMEDIFRASVIVAPNVIGISYTRWMELKSSNKQRNAGSVAGAPPPVR